MSLRKLCLFMLIAAIAAFAAVGTLSVQIREYEVPTPKYGRTIQPSRLTARFGTPGRERTSSGA